jgi:hypothetical protein
MVPVGVPVPEDVATVAEKTTDLPNTDGLEAEVSTVVVETPEEFTTWVMTLEVEPLKLVEAPP